jgi:putative transcriptional regulator
MIQAKLLPDGRLVQVLPDGTTRPLPDHTDWARLDAMTEEDVHAAALADPDNPPLTEEQLAQFEGVPNVKAIREKLHLSQKQFADTFGLSLSVVRDWEQGRFVPDQAARTLLKVIAQGKLGVRSCIMTTVRYTSPYGLALAIRASSCAVSCPLP